MLALFLSLSAPEKMVSGTTMGILSASIIDSITWRTLPESRNWMMKQDLVSSFMWSRTTQKLFYLIVLAMRKSLRWEHLHSNLLTSSKLILIAVSHLFLWLSSSRKAMVRCIILSCLACTMIFLIITIRHLELSGPILCSKLCGLLEPRPQKRLICCLMLPSEKPLMWFKRIAAWIYWWPTKWSF